MKKIISSIIVSLSFLLILKAIESPNINTNKQELGILPPELQRIIGEYLSTMDIVHYGMTSRLRNLRLLKLSMINASDKGLSALAKSENFPNLTHLNFAGNYVSHKGAFAFAESLNSSKLIILNLKSTFIGWTGTKAICESQNFPDLKQLFT